MKCRELSETRFPKVWSQTEPSSGGKRRDEKGEGRAENAERRAETAERWTEKPNVEPKTLFVIKFKMSILKHRNKMSILKEKDSIRNRR